MDFNADDIQEQIHKIDDLISKDFRGLGAFETTQYFRGTLFVM